MNNTISDRLRTLVSNNELKEAIDVILSLYKDTPEDKKNFTNETILLKQQLTTWNQLYITGQEPASKDKARIAYSILLIADNLASGNKLESSYL